MKERDRKSLSPDTKRARSACPTPSNRPHRPVARGEGFGHRARCRGREHRGIARQVGRASDTRSGALRENGYLVSAMPRARDDHRSFPPKARHEVLALALSPPHRARGGSNELGRAAARKFGETSSNPGAPKLDWMNTHPELEQIVGLPNPRGTRRLRPRALSEELA